jgi:FAD:protein FMN transferase
MSCTRISSTERRCHDSSAHFPRRSVVATAHRPRACEVAGPTDHRSSGCRRDIRGRRPRIPRRVRHRTLRNPTDCDELNDRDHVPLGHRQLVELRLDTIDLDRFDLWDVDLLGELDSGDGFGSDMSPAMQFDGRSDPAALEVGEEPVALRSMQAIGTTATVVVSDPARADLAGRELACRLGALDAACSRFRPDSELRRIERTAAGRPVEVSPLLYDLLEVGCAVAVLTAGAVDPTVGSALMALGYDRDFEEVRRRELAEPGDVAPAHGWWRIALDPVRRTVSITEGVHIDLGATAKAFAADQAARQIADLAGCGVLVNLGGDVAVGGPPPTDGWPVGIAATHSVDPRRADEVVRLSDGGLATSGTTARSWQLGGRRVHHIVDPSTGEACEPVWSLVSTLAPSCVEANSFATAAVVWGGDAPGNLSAYGACARLVGQDGSVTYVGEWPLPGIWRETTLVG